MTKKDYEKTMGILLKPISETDDVVFIGKDGRKIKGTDLLRIKPVKINKTETGNIEENDLQTEMKTFLKELQNEKNDN